MARKPVEKYRQRLSSLTTHMRKFEKPRPHGYDAFATSYISSDIPWNKILSDETDSYTAESLPFPTQFEVEQLTGQEKERKFRGESERKKDLLPSTGHIIENLKTGANILDKDLHLAHLYFKAMQYSKVNKALALDGKYPKPDSQVIRSTFSKEHQEAAAAVRKNKEDRGALKPSKYAETLFQQNERQLVTIPQVKYASSENRGMATVGDSEALLKLHAMIEETLGKPSPPKELQLIKEPWQFKAGLGRTRVQPSVQRKVPWKKNIYPPKSKEERIAELRKLVPPLRSEHLQTDFLPGLWEPELMCEAFQTFYLETQENDKGLLAPKEDWWKLFYSKMKCLEWLKAIPDSL